MEIKNCPSCSKELSPKAAFCGKCKTQVKCLNCEAPLGVDDLCCEICGTDTKTRSGNGATMNRIRYDGQTFEAEFTDNVGKDVNETFGKIFLATRGQLEAPQSNIELSDAVEIDSSSPKPTDLTDSKVEIKNSGVASIFRKSENGRIDLLETRIKATGKVDYAARLTYLLVLYGQDQGTYPIKKKVLNDLLKFCGLYDANYRKWFGSAKSDFLVDKGALEFRPAGKGKAQTYLEDVFNPDIEEKWDLSMLKSGGKSKSSPSKGGKTGDEEGNEGKKKASSSSQKLNIVGGLDLHPKGKLSLKDYYAQFEVKSNFEKNLVFVSYLETVIKEPVRGVEHVYSCYKNVGERIPKNLYQSLIDTKKHKAWIETNDIEKLAVTTNGENALDHDLKIKD